jgi:hypothetical protein
MMKLQAHAGGHWKLEDWHKELVDADSGKSATSEAQTPIGLGVAPTINSGPLLYWRPGTPLPEQRLYNHLPNPLRRLQQRIVHPLLLPILDSRRPQYNPSYQASEIPPEISKTIYG